MKIPPAAVSDVDRVHALATDQAFDISDELATAGTCHSATHSTMAIGEAGRSLPSKHVNNHADNAEDPCCFGVVRRLMDDMENYCEATYYHLEEMAKMMPPQAMPFLLERRRSPLTVQKFARFWSDPTICEYTRGEKAGSAAVASWFLATQALKDGRVPEAGALTLNACFLYQCIEWDIETIVEMCGENFSNPVEDCELPILQHGYDAIRTPRMLKRFLKDDPSGKDRGPTFYDGMCPTNENEKMACVGSISDEWKSFSASNHQNPSPGEPTSGALVGTQIQIMLVDDTNHGLNHSFNVGSSTPLKALFNNYAEKRGVSLRSLRFSYRGKTLFLSSVGKKTPDDLNLGDRDIINVIDTSAPAQDSSSGSSNQIEKKAKSRSRPKRKGRRKVKIPTPREESAETHEQLKARHSKMLTNLHEELHPRLKEIRDRLNALGLERQPPKQKKRSKRKTKMKGNADRQLLPHPGMGGKAGKPYFVIHVGEVMNLYKTKKSFHLGRPGTSITLDLHGYCKNQALNTLNEKLPEWVDTAMNGDYPWVMTVQIICGCGSQVLSEAIQEWIRLTRNVSNAPKNCLS